MGRVLTAFPRYWKFWISTLTPAFLLVQAAVTDDRVTTTEWVGIVAAGVLAGGVLAKGNAEKPPQA